MADPKDKSGASPQAPTPGPALPSIPRLTPAVPEPVAPSKAAVPPPLPAAKPPSVTPPPGVPKVAPLVPPPGTGAAPRPPAGTPPPASTARKTGSFPAVPSVAPVVAPSGTPLPQVAPVLPAVSAQPKAARPANAPEVFDEQAELQRRFQDLDQLDYFQLMGLEVTAALDDIKRGFRHLSRTFHPDRFFQSTDAELRGRVHAVYKRITEAYFVLRDDARRKKYLADISGPDRLHKLRFDELAEAEAKAQVKREVAEQIGTHPKGRQFFQVGVADLEAGRLSSAERNIKLALTYEPTNPLYLQKLEEARAKSYEEFKRSGKGFRIE
jgi:hypothetical protein